MAKTLSDAVRILQFKSGISFEDAKKEWRRMAMRLHPDRNKTRDTTEEFKAAKAAWEFFETKFSSSITCTWNEQTSSNSSSGYYQYSREGRKSEKTANNRSQRKTQYEYDYYKERARDAAFDDEFDDEFDDYDYDYDVNSEYSSSYSNQKVDPHFRFLHTGSAREIGREFFKSYFELMKSKIDKDSLSVESDTKVFIKGVAELLSRYPLRVIDVDYFAYEYSKALWSLQNESVFKFSTHVYSKFKDMSKDLSRVINPYSVISKPSYIDEKDTFNALYMICTDASADKDPQRRKFVEYILENYANKNSPFYELGDKGLNTSVFYQDVLKARPHLIPVLMKHGCINFGNSAYEDKGLNPLRDVLSSNMDLGDVSKTLLQGWSVFEKSLVSELKELDIDKVRTILNGMVARKESSMAWIVENFSKRWYPDSPGFKRVYSEYRKPIEENIDVIRLNEKLAVELLNQKYNEMNSVLFRVGKLCSNLFGSEKQDNVLDKLAESLGVSRDTLAKQFDPDKGEFVLRSEELYSGQP